MVGSSIGGWLMLLAAIARPEKTAALVGISTAADHIVTSFNSLPIEVGTKCYRLHHIFGISFETFHFLKNIFHCI